MSAAKIKKGDKIVVLAGKDKGRTGSVLQVLPKDDKVRLFLMWASDRPLSNNT